MKKSKILLPNAWSALLTSRSKNKNLFCCVRSVTSVEGRGTRFSSQKQQKWSAKLKKKRANTEPLTNSAHHSKQFFIGGRHSRRRRRRKGL